MRPVEPRCRPVVLGGGALAIVLGLLNVPAQAASLSGRVESVSASEVVVTLTEPKAGEGLRVGDVGFVLEPSGERIARLEVKTISGASVGAALDGVTRQVTPGAQVVFDVSARPSAATATAPGDPIAAEGSAEAQRRSDGLQSLPLDREAARTYLEAGDWAKAVERMAKIAAVAPDDPWLVETLGERQAQVEKALASSTPLAAEPLCVGVSALPSGNGLRAACERRAGAGASGVGGAPASGKVGGRIAQPKLLHRVEPRYPAGASGIAGLVILDIEVDPRGNVAAAKVLRGHPLFDRAALDAVKQWRYEPLRLNGREASFHLTVTLLFRP